MSDTTYDELMKFVVDFRSYYEEYGIDDKLNKQTNKMETSPGVHDLVTRARKISPPPKIAAAAKTMRELPEDAVEKAVKASDNVIDLRTAFAKKIAENGGTKALIANLVDAYNEGDTGSFAKALADMETLTKADRGDNVFNKENKIDG